MVMVVLQQTVINSMMYILHVFIMKKLLHYLLLLFKYQHQLIHYILVVLQHYLLMYLTLKILTLIGEIILLHFKLDYIKKVLVKMKAGETLQKYHLLVLVLHGIILLKKLKMEFFKYEQFLKKVKYIMKQLVMNTLKLSLNQKFLK